MARLIHLNGPPGIGKSTLARRYVAAHPGALNCDIDVLRGFIGGWEADFERAGALVRPAALALISAYLAAGEEVVLPQMLVDPAELARFERAATDVGAQFVEIVLMDTPEAVVARFHARGAEGDDPWHYRVRAIVRSQGGDEVLLRCHAALARIALDRPSAVVVPTVGGAIEEAYRAVVTALSAVPTSGGASNADPSDEPWRGLAAGYEQARAREDSLDRLVEWPAQRELLGDVTGLTILDAGCGSGAKLAELVHAGAGPSVGVDISGHFIDPPSGLELIRGDLSDLAAAPGLADRCFDRILFLQSFGYAADGVHALRTARRMLTDDGFILLTRTQPVRYALERAEQNGTTLGEEYFAKGDFSYRHAGWDDDVTLTKKPYTMSDLLNTFSAAGLYIEAVVEPQLSAEAAARHPHKQAVLNTYLGILVFRLRPIPGGDGEGDEGHATPLDPD